MDKNRVIQITAAAITAAVTAFTGIYVAARPEPEMTDTVEQVNRMVELSKTVQASEKTRAEKSDGYKAKAEELRTKSSSGAELAAKSEDIAQDIEALNSKAAELEEKINELDSRFAEKKKTVDGLIEMMSSGITGEPPAPPEEMTPPDGMEPPDGMVPPENEDQMMGGDPSERMAEEASAAIEELNAILAEYDSEDVLKIVKEGEELSSKLDSDIEAYKKKEEEASKPKPTKKPSSSGSSSSSKSSSSSGGGSSSGSGSSSGGGSSSSSSSSSGRDSSYGSSSYGGSSYYGGGYSSYGGSSSGSGSSSGGGSSSSSSSSSGRDSSYGSSSYYGGGYSSYGGLSSGGGSSNVDRTTDRKE